MKFISYVIFTISVRLSQIFLSNLFCEISCVTTHPTYEKKIVHMAEILRFYKINF